MRVKIFSCNHVEPDHVISTALYQTFVSGYTPRADSAVLTDIRGDNIADLQKFCELRHQYYIWKNELSSYDYVGFEHYRRPFYLDPLPYPDLVERYPLMARLRLEQAMNPNRTQLSVRTPVFDAYNHMRESFDETATAALTAWIADHDIILTYPIFHRTDANMRFHHPHLLPYWEELASGLRDRWTDVFPVAYSDQPYTWSGYLNSYILRADLFDAYMSLLFGTLLEMDARHPDAPPRTWGHLTERTFGAFVGQLAIERPGLRFAAVPHLLHVKD